jgi:4-amino-4-deoxy-L-arabinose transferase-like glycosyltransferase
VILLLAAGILCFTQFGSPLQEPQEARYAEIPRQMLAEGRFVVPVLHGQPYYDKPPLFYWLVMASYRFFGVHDWAARLVCCSIAFLTVLTTYWWGRGQAGWRAGFLGAMILCLSPRFLQLDRMVTMDGLFSLCVVTAWATGQRALADGRFRLGWWLGSALACGLGLLTKGPVALVLVLVPLAVLRWIDPGAGRAGLRGLAGYLAVSTGLAAPWFVAVALQDGCFVEYFFWFHHVQRFVEPFDHEEPIWFYLPVLFLGMLPWTLLLPGLLAGRLRQASGLSLIRDEVEAPAERIHSRTVRLGGSGFLAPCLWCLVFFSLAGCKRAFYILPAMPPLALALGCYLDSLLPMGDSVRSWWRAMWQYRSRLALAAAALVLIGGLGGALAGTCTGVISSTPAWALCSLPGTGLALLLYHGARRRWSVSWALAGVVSFVVLFGAVYGFLPGYARKFALRDQVCGQTTNGGQVPVYCYPRRWDSVSFYLQRDDVRAFSAEELPCLIRELEKAPAALLFLKTGRPGGSPSQDLIDRLPATLRFETLDRQGMLTVGLVRRSGS